jgi:probable addiction module antidote protein
MVRRHSYWKDGLAERLQDSEYAGLFLLALIEEGDSIQRALGIVVRSMGVKEFAAKVGMPSSNVLRAIHLNHNPTMATLERMLNPLGVRLSAEKIPTPKPRRRARAHR